MANIGLCFCLHRLPPSSFHEIGPQHRYEIEARNICQWLFAAGFPQYVQMFQERCCPIDLAQVERDHQFLDALSLQLLVGQVKLLNHLSSQKITITLSRQELGGSSDNEDDQALSDQWTCQAEKGRWTHKFLPKTKTMSNHRKLSCSSSCDSALADSPKISAGNHSAPSSTSGPAPVKNRSSSLKGFKRSSFPFRHRSRTPLSRGSSASDSEPSSDGSPMSTSWNGGVGDRAKSRSFRNIFRRSDSHKSRKAAAVAANHGRPPSAPSSGRLDIGDPVFVSTPEIAEKMDRLKCVDINSQDGKSSDIPTKYGVVSEESLLALNNNCGSTCDAICVVADRKRPVPDEHRRALSESCGDKNDSLIHLNRWSNHCSYERKSGSTQNSETLSEHDQNSCLNKSSKAARLSSLQERNLEIVEKSEEWKHADQRRSFYDNLSSNFGDEVPPSDPQLELDLILVEIYRNIDSLNETLQGVENPQSLETDSISVFEDDPETDVSAKMPSTPSLNNHVSKLVVELENGNLVTSEKNCSVQSDSKCDVILNLCDPATTTHGRNTTTAVDNLTKIGKGIPNCFGREYSAHISSSIPNSDKCVDNGKTDLDGVNDPGCFVSSYSSCVENGRQRLRWDSFSRDHLSTFTEECGNLSGMTAGQMSLLYKLNLVRLTSIMEKYVPSVPLSSYWIRSKSVHHDQQSLSGGVFGRSLLSNLRLTGRPLPAWIIYAMQRIRRSAVEAIGIFRKSGVRSRIQQLRDQIDTDPDCIDFESLQVYDVADILKLYFRELPDCLLTRPLSQIFISIFQNVPSELRLDGLRAAIVLLPDENRDVLQCLLFFLMDLSQFASKNQMTASNLAICFAPSLFHVYGLRETSPSPASPQLRGNKLSPATGLKELHEQQAAQECLTYMIIKAKELFSVSSEFLTQCCHLQLYHLPLIHPFDQTSQEIYMEYLKQTVDDTLQELSDNFKSWAAPEFYNGIELSYKKTDGPLRMWMCRVNLLSSPLDVLTRVQSERHLWDDSLVKGCVVDRLDSNMDVFRYVISSMAPQPPRAFSVLRLWQTSLSHVRCILVSTSIDHMEKVKKPADGVAGLVLTSRYLVESCGNQKSRLTFISQVDLRGYTPHWYRKVYGHLCVNMMMKLRDSLNVDRETRA